MATGAAGPMRLDAVGVRYGRDHWVLRDVSMDLPAGRLVAVLGPNGSGKSTLLRVVAGVQRPTAGRVVGRGGPVAYVPERIEPPALSIDSWSAHLRRVRGVAGASFVAALDELAVTAPRHDLLGTLSKGTWRKVLLAEALTSGCATLVLDEPWADLDADAGRVLTDRLVAAARAGALVLASDHTGAARRVADQVVGPSGEVPPDPATECSVRYRGPAGSAAALDAAAARLGFRPEGR